MDLYKSNKIRIFANENKQQIVITIKQQQL